MYILKNSISIGWYFPGYESHFTVFACLGMFYWILDMVNLYCWTSKFCFLLLLYVGLCSGRLGSYSQISMIHPRPFLSFPSSHHSRGSSALLWGPDPSRVSGECSGWLLWTIHLLYLACCRPSGYLPSCKSWDSLTYNSFLLWLTLEFHLCIHGLVLSKDSRKP